MNLFNPAQPTVRFQRLRAIALLAVALVQSQPGLAQSGTTDPIFRNGFEPPSGRQLPPAGAVLARSYGIWIPNPLYDSCPKSLHDTYWVYGPDGKVYPTWHPPVDIHPETGQPCTYGHEHGDDPALSGFADWPLPFGYVNEVLADTDPANPRHEDHVGHKVMFKRDVRVGVPGDDIGNFTGGSGPTCSILAKLHQGTHSPDAFTNNMHELFFGMRCANGIEVRWMSMHMFGPGGSFERRCAGRFTTGTASPPNSPTNENQSSRGIPDATCLDDVFAAIQAGADASGPWYGMQSEDWPTGTIHELRRRNGAFYDNWGQAGADLNGEVLFAWSAGAYFLVNRQSRYFDPARPNRLARTVELCSIPALRFFNPCNQIAAFTGNGQVLAWDSPASPFSGALRTTHFDWVRVQNTTGNPRFYSNAWGTVARPQADPANAVIIEQYIVAPATPRMYYFGRKEADYRTTGVRAPN